MDLSKTLGSYRVYEDTINLFLWVKLKGAFLRVVFTYNYDFQRSVHKTINSIKSNLPTLFEAHLAGNGSI